MNPEPPDFDRHVIANTPPDHIWKYINPVTATGPLNQGDAIPGGPGGGNMVFKIRRYAADYPGLSGRDLTPRGTVETYALLRNLQATLHTA